MNVSSFFQHASDIAGIRAVMLRYKTALDRLDIDDALACYVEHAEISAISLDSVYRGRDEVKRFLERLFSPESREETSRMPKELHICVYGETAVLVVEHELRLVRPAVRILPCRVTFTLVRVGRRWQILSSHLSASRTAFEEVGEARH